MRLNNIKILLVILLSITFISAGWPLPKYPTCAMLNVTNEQCDMTWCNVIDCSYDSNRTACICGSGETTNSSLNQTWLESFVIDLLTRMNYTNVSEIMNDTNITLSDYYTKQEIDNLTFSLRDNVLNSQENRTKELVQAYIPDNVESYSQPISPWIYVVGIFGVLSFLAFMSWNSAQNKKLNEQRQRIKPLQRNIDTTDDFYGKKLEPIKADEENKKVKKFLEQSE